MERALLELENWYRDEYLAYGFENQTIEEIIEEMKSFMGWQLWKRYILTQNGLKTL